MANELFNSLKIACAAGGRIVNGKGVGGGTGRFARAGMRQASATFFGSSRARGINRNTLNKSIEVFDPERIA